MQVGGDVISADRVVIAGGSRPFVPPIPGLDDVPYLTSDEALHLEALPRRLAIVGGGYISCELAHFFGALGSAVTIIEPSQRLLSREDAEIGAAFTERYRTTHDVRLGARVRRVTATAGGVRVHLDGGEDVEADQLLVATGRTPNSDLLDLAAAGLALDARGHVVVNEYLETGQDGVWALGDITGVLPLKHVAVRQARHISRALFDGDRRPMRYDVIPHAVFSAPQVAAVGRTEEELRAEGRPYKVGRWRLRDTAMGMALREDGLVKAAGRPGRHDPGLPHRGAERVAADPRGGGRDDRGRRPAHDRRHRARAPGAVADRRGGVQGRAGGAGRSGLRGSISRAGPLGRSARPCRRCGAPRLPSSSPATRPRCPGRPGSRRPARWRRCGTG